MTSLYLESDVMDDCVNGASELKHEERLKEDKVEDQFFCNQN